jgi:hypothetical protein
MTHQVDAHLIESKLKSQELSPGHLLNWVSAA